MPDEAREVVFPSGVPVRMLSEKQSEQAERKHHSPRGAGGDSTANAAEGDLASEAEEINQQAKNARAPEAGQNLLEA
jgi:hypothetical protein